MSILDSLLVLRLFKGRPQRNDMFLIKNERMQEIKRCCRGAGSAIAAPKFSLDIFVTFGGTSFLTTVVSLDVLFDFL